ncbi:MAG: nucleotidyltransferase domain-containing protein [Chitinophagaceae bacterium]
MILTQENIKQIVQAYFKDKPVKEVYLFGSYARGDAKEDSDVDLIVEIDDTKKG